MNYLLNFTTQWNSQIKATINTQGEENAELFSVKAGVSWSCHFASKD
jgi:hypothetical protein